MGLLTEDPVPPGFTGTRLGRLQPLRGDLRDRADPRATARSPGSGATRRTRSRAATSAPRASRWPTSTPTPTGCAGPCAGRRGRRRDVGGARLGRGLRPGRRPAGRHHHEHGADAVGVYLGNPNAHSLGLRHPRRAVREGLRTRNRFSASTVDQIPHQFVAWQLFGHQLLLPVPDLDRTVVLPGARRQPDGLQRLADDGAGLPAAGARPQGARRPDGRARPAAHRDREGRHRAPLRAPRLRRGGAARHAARAVRGGAHHSPAVRRPRRPGRASWSPTSRPSGPRPPAACRPRRSAR